MFGHHFIQLLIYLRILHQRNRSHYVGMIARKNHTRRTFQSEFLVQGQTQMESHARAFYVGLYVSMTYHFTKWLSDTCRRKEKDVDSQYTCLLVVVVTCKSELGLRGKARIEAIVVELSQSPISITLSIVYRIRILPFFRSFTLVAHNRRPRMVAHFCRATHGTHRVSWYTALAMILDRFYM